MNVFLKQKIWLLLIPLLPLFLQGCGNRYADEVQQYHATAEKQMALLKQQLDGRQLSNALLTQTYADTLAKNQPSLAPIAQALKRDATSNGGMYQNFANRLKDVNLTPEREADYQLAIEELNNITVGSDPVVFNDSLLDQVNTLADLSQGQLARINVPKGEAAQNLKDGKNAVPGSYLVGNPSYGSFKQDSSGQSFWAWYGQYAMLRSVIGMFQGPIYARDWYSQPRYSYYNDYGRNSYGSPQARQSWDNTKSNLAKKGITPATPKKDFRSTAGKQRMSTYAYKRETSRKQYGAKTRQQAANAPPGRGSANKSQRTSAFSSFKPSSRGTSSGSRSTRFGK